MPANDDDFRDDAKTTAIQKATRLMQAIATAEEPQQLAELAQQVGMPKPTVHRLLAQLEEVGMIGHDLGGKGFTIGATWLQLAVDALLTRAKQPAIRGIMRKLVDQIQESCNLGMLQDYEVLYLERVECDWPLRMQLRSGSRVPLHCTASGKLFLANMSPSLLQKVLPNLRLQKFTSHTITDLDTLRQEIETIRQTGISTNREEYNLGLIGVAVPLRRRDKTVAATLSIHAPSFRMSLEAALGHLPLLQQTAAEIASEIGLNQPDLPD
jgi:DNA-binding IclR family transcriptional regulator